MALYNTTSEIHYGTPPRLAKGTLPNPLREVFIRAIKQTVKQFSCFQQTFAFTGFAQKSFALK
jgi:hypothetical protein